MNRVCQILDIRPRADAAAENVNTYLKEKDEACKKAWADGYQELADEANRRWYNRLFGRKISPAKMYFGWRYRRWHAAVNNAQWEYKEAKYLKKTIDNIVATCRNGDQTDEVILTDEEYRALDKFSPQKGSQ